MYLGLSIRARSSPLGVDFPGGPCHFRAKRGCVRSNLQLISHKPWKFLCSKVFAKTYVVGIEMLKIGMFVTIKNLQIELKKTEGSP